MSMTGRIAVVAACRYVDRVVEDAPLYWTHALLDRIGADFACHGDDFTPAQLAHWHKDIIGSGRLKVVPYSAIVSTKVIIERVVQYTSDASQQPQTISV